MREGCAERRTKGSGSSTCALPRKGAPSPASGVRVCPADGNISRFLNFDRFHTCHIHGVSPASCAYKILFWIKTFLFFSDTSLSEMGNPSALP